MAEHTKGKVLYVDESEIWRRQIRRMLERAGYAVALAATFEEAKAILEQEGETLDAAVIEVCLDECDFSNEDGMRLAEHIVNAGQQISVIMLTGHGTVDRCRRAFRDLNVFDFLQKERVDFPGGFIDILAQAAEHK